MFNWLKRKKILAEKSSEDVGCSFGSYNTETGKVHKGVILNGKMIISEEGELVKNVDGKDWADRFNKVANEYKHLAWGEPVFVGTIKVRWDNFYSSWFSSPKCISHRYESYSLYKRTNYIDNNSEYYYYREGIKRRIDADAFEHCKEVILLDED